MKKITLRASLMFLLFLAFTINVNAQKKDLKRVEHQLGFELSETNRAYFEESGVVRCASYEHNEKLRREGKLSANDELEEIIKKGIVREKLEMASGRAATVYTIPVVVHVYHKGEAVGTGTNISEDVINSQITVLNQDFRKMTGTPGHNTHAAGADTEIQFCLAKIDPSGNPTTGITRRQGISGSYDTNAFDAEKPNSQWDPTKYLNIWVADLGASLLGYAQFPHANGVISGMTGGYAGGASNTDGVVMGPNFFGSSDITTVPGSAPFDKGRTTTHEVGHWLGLKHINGDAGCGSDDECADTPNQENQTNQANGCNQKTSCGSVDMIENYMDYSNDACMNIFTNDQTARMRAILNPANNIVNRGTLVQAGTTHTLCSQDPDFELAVTNSPVTVCAPNNGVFNLTFTTENGYNANTTFAATAGVPAGASVAFSPTSMNADGNFTMTVSNTGAVAAGNYTITITATGSVTKTIDVELSVQSAAPATPTLTVPANNATNQPTSVNLTWNAAANAATYTVETATDAGFTANLTTNSVTGTTYNATGLATGTQYFWRVKAVNGCGESSYSSVFNFTTATPACTTYNSTQNNIAIPTSGATNHVITSTINVADDVSITDVNVTINVQHTWAGDVELKLTSPNGTEVILLPNSKCDDGTDDIAVTYDDQAAGALTCSTSAPAVGGTVQPENPLSPFNGESSNGNWVLTVTDGYPSADGGTFQNYSIEICGTPVLSIDENNLAQSVKVFPNPSNGTINVSFESDSSKNVSLSLFDIRGRLITEQHFENNSSIFNKEVRFNNLEKAVYILKIENGNNKLFKRLIIQ